MSATSPCSTLPQPWSLERPGERLAEVLAPVEIPEPSRPDDGPQPA